MKHHEKSPLTYSFVKWIFNIAIILTSPVMPLELLIVIFKMYLQLGCPLFMVLEYETQSWKAHTEINEHILKNLVDKYETKSWKAHTEINKTSWKIGKLDQLLVLLINLHTEAIREHKTHTIAHTKTRNGKQRITIALPLHLNWQPKSRT